MLQRLGPIDPCELIEMTCSAPTEIDSLFSRSMGGGDSRRGRGREEVRGRKTDHRAGGKSLSPSRRAAKSTLKREREADEAKGG